MKSIKARVVNGRLVVDEPTKFPEGTELDLTVADNGDELSDEERAALHEALHASWKSAQAGELKPARDLLDKLASAE
ncbi:MAG: hypothetical protein O7J95_12125 [Planctomycetota bacterium]|nr:hypothetical protein [Planctomycetota bacterium]